jgi:hypothetical protein
LTVLALAFRAHGDDPRAATFHRIEHLVRHWDRRRLLLLGDLVVDVCDLEHRLHLVDDLHVLTVGDEDPQRLGRSGRRYGGGLLDLRRLAVARHLLGILGDGLLVFRHGVFDGFRPWRSAGPGFDVLLELRLVER